MYLSTRKIHYYIEATVSSVEPMGSFTLVRFGKRHLAKPPSECLLQEGQKVEVTIDPYKNTLINIASVTCTRCPLKGNACRYGIEGYKSKPL